MENLTTSKENKIIKRLFASNVTIAVLGILASLVFAFKLPDKNLAYLSGIVILLSISISSAILRGISEVIELLEEIKNKK